MTKDEFKSVMLPCYASMYRTAYAIMRNADDASDAVQECISSLWQRHQSIPLPNNPVKFCSMAVRNCCIDNLRSAANRYHESIDVLLQSSGSNGEADRNASFSSTLAYLKQMLDTFPKAQCQVLSLSFISQLSNDEIAEVTGQSLSNIRQIISRGRIKLRQLFENETRP